MAIKKIKKEKEEKLQVVEAEKKILEAIDKVAESDKPILKEELNGDLTILGDPKKVVEDQNKTEYEIFFVFDKETHNTEDYEDIVFENENYFTVKTIATQEKITPYNRTFLTVTALDILVNFFVQQEDGGFELIKGEDMVNKTYRVFRNENFVENIRYFVGRLLGIDEEFIPYMNDIQLIEIAVKLIIANPTLINEAYFKLK